MDELEQHRAAIRARKEKQNERRAKAGKPPMHPELVKPKKSKAAVPPHADSGKDVDTEMTFEEWKAFGWAVKKGAKAVSFSMSGDAQFNRKQVRKINPQWAKWKSRR